METEKKIRKFKNSNGYEHYVVYSNGLWWDENGYVHAPSEINTEPAELSEESENILCEICDIAANDLINKSDPNYAREEYSYDAWERLETLAKDFAHSRGQLHVKEFADELNAMLKELAPYIGDVNDEYLKGFKFGSINQCRIDGPRYSSLDKVRPFSKDVFNFDNVLLSNVLGNEEIEIPYKYFVDEDIIQEFEEENEDDDFPWYDYIPEDDWMEWADSVVNILNTGECDECDDMDMACIETVEKLQLKERNSMLENYLYFEGFKEAGYYREGESISWITQYQFPLPKKLTKETAQELLTTIVIRAKEAESAEETLYDFEEGNLFEEDEQDLDEQDLDESDLY